MSSASHTNWPQGAVRLVATGIGATVSPGGIAGWDARRHC